MVIALTSLSTSSIALMAFCRSFEGQLSMTVKISPCNTPARLLLGNDLVVEVDYQWDENRWLFTHSHRISAKSIHACVHVPSMSAVHRKFTSNDFSEP